MFDDQETSSETNPEIADIQKLIKQEMLILMVDDNMTHPQKGMKQTKLP